MLLSNLFFLILASWWRVCFSDEAVAFGFANTQGDYMVLQQAPYRSQVWGFAQSGQTVAITLKRSTDGQVMETVNVMSQNDNIWQVQLMPIVGENDVEYQITAELVTTGQQLSLLHVLFGDVFVCSGQSNMQMTVSQAFNSTTEIANANNYPNIRVFTVALTNASSPQDELVGIAEEWSIASSSSVGGADWDFLSALCWFYGRNLYEYLNYPVGLIASSYGGTPIRYWMPTETLQECNETSLPELSDSSLWNAMIYPLVRSTIRGVIWFRFFFFFVPSFVVVYCFVYVHTYMLL
ncbi:hypothetical protein RFI_23490 [Reticulomyxa filosa]|uniref:Sialate O-acetylesterase domain-containing protein n=1 Tax=Reticulomyxa filosa TaxID=46433 RepID=X6MIS6_RETFI|nr:hypothetical protein RFI_23490 [Reticulomyxa filosa]|eukprot:ETO13878.1 hypothetical protein RFI_23490 [Reticulomyxa filosa]